ALARYVLDHPEAVAGRRVLDLASGSGLVAIAARLAGAADVTANDIDALSTAAIALNADLNGVGIAVVDGDLLGGTPDGYDVVLAGDVFYDRGMADRVLPFLRAAVDRGGAVLVGDPQRAHLPHAEFTVLASYDVPVHGALESAEVKRTTVLRPK
ncbi:MAG TPA: 50S ribosomal protein L11 methyltransferase, partial [Umezawaea sp.]|nr:50S ribosomal protein L11 methyltransferase [Umezawaea sp.]